MTSDAAVEAAMEAFLLKSIEHEGTLAAKPIALVAALEAAEPLMVAAKAIAAVLELHREMPCTDEEGDPVGGSYCEECKDLDDHSGERVHEIYPCRTVREIQDALAGRSTWTDMRNKIEEMVK